jgi:hypothetical protein
MNRRISKKRLKKELLILLEKTPIIQFACMKLGVARSTIYRWINEDYEFNKEMEEAMSMGRSTVNDLAESKLINKINNEDFKAIKFWLTANKKEVYGPPKVIEHQPEKVSLSDEAIAEMDEFVKKNNIHQDPTMGIEVVENKNL